MKRLAIVTSTRAEYGLLAPIVRRLREYESESLKVELVVTGTHLDAGFGMTVDEIRADGVRIDEEVPIPVVTGSAADISRNQAATLIAFAELFERKSYNAVLMLGDRYEILAVAIAASNALVPIFHVSGGDVTEGAVDDCIRHAVTKMAYLHFPTNSDSARRIVQLGESPDRVFCYGSTSIDNIMSTTDMDKAEVMASVGVSNPSYAVCTFHPVTLEEGGVEKQVGALVEAIASFPEIDFVVTKSNADRGGAFVNELLDSAAEQVPNMHVFASLGVRRYLSLMRYALFVVGNSSSGIVEAPAFQVPTVNIGDRQRGRLRAASVVDCAPDALSITAAIEQVMSDEMQGLCAGVSSPYGAGYAAPRIAAKCIEALGSSVDLKKRFFDIEFQMKGE